MGFTLGFPKFSKRVGHFKATCVYLAEIFYGRIRKKEGKNPFHEKTLIHVTGGISILNGP